MTTAAFAPTLRFTLQEYPSADYAGRTEANAKADATWAYAVDFESAGERLTKKAAGTRILQTAVGTTSQDAAEALIAHLQARKARTLNVAGNGLYTLARRYPKADPRELQAKLDGYVLRVLTLVHARHPLAQVRSGGQTGVDEAGIKAGIALGIPTVALLPQGFRMRTAAGKDVTMDYAEAWNRFVSAEFDQ